MPLLRPPYYPRLSAPLTQQPEKPAEVESWKARYKLAGHFEAIDAHWTPDGPLFDLWVRGAADGEGLRFTMRQLMDHVRDLLWVINAASAVVRTRPPSGGLRRLSVDSTAMTRDEIQEALIDGTLHVGEHGVPVPDLIRGPR